MWKKKAILEKIVELERYLRKLTGVTMVKVAYVLTESTRTMFPLLVDPFTLGPARNSFMFTL